MIGWSVKWSNTFCLTAIQLQLGVGFRAYRPHKTTTSTRKKRYPRRNKTPPATAEPLEHNSVIVEGLAWHAKDDSAAAALGMFTNPIRRKQKGV